MNFVTAKEARSHFHVTAQTLRNWVKNGCMKSQKISNRKFLYDIDSYDTETGMLKESNEDSNRMTVIYARVSNTKQINDLNEQIETIKQYCFSNGVLIDKVYKDVASGMNESRKSFNDLINDVISNKIKTVYISFKDRLTRFGYDYFLNIFKKFNTEIVVLDNNESTSKTFQDEMSEDLISIIHHFSMKMYSNRRKRLKEFKRILEEDKNTILEK